jgi:hypothetical protein
MQLISVLSTLAKFQLTLRTKDVRATIAVIDELLREKNHILLTTTLAKKLKVFRAALIDKGDAFDNDRMLKSVLNGVTTRHVILHNKFNTQASQQAK